MGLQHVRDTLTTSAIRPLFFLSFIPQMSHFFPLRVKSLFLYPPSPARIHRFSLGCVIPPLTVGTKSRNLRQTFLMGSVPKSEMQAQHDTDVGSTRSHRSLKCNSVFCPINVALCRGDEIRGRVWNTCKVLGAYIYDVLGFGFLPTLATYQYLCLLFRSPLPPRVRTSLMEAPWADTYGDLEKAHVTTYKIYKRILARACMQRLHFHFHFHFGFDR